MGALLGEEQVLVEMLCQGLAWSQEGHLGPPPLPLAYCLMAPENLGCLEAWQGLRSRLQRAEKVKPAHLPFLFLLLEVALHSENGSSGLWPSAFRCEFCFECWESVVVWPVVLRGEKSLYLPVTL